MAANFPYTVIDLTHTLDEHTPSWEGGCGFKLDTVLDYSECTTAVRFRVQQMCLNAGIGTHMDAPAHCFDGGATIDQVPLSKLVAPCVVIALPESCHDCYSLLPVDIERFEKKHGIIEPGSFMMIHTGWERFWHIPKKYRNNHIFPFVSESAAELLLERGVVGLGIDTLSPDRPDSGFKVHSLFLSAGNPLIENVANLGLLPVHGSFIIALPLKIRGATEAPLRLIALVPNAF